MDVGHACYPPLIYVTWYFRTEAEDVNSKGQCNLCFYTLAEETVCVGEAVCYRAS